MRRRENRPPVRLKRCAVRVVPDVWYVGCLGIEGGIHVLNRQLREGARLESEIFHDFVYALDSTCCVDA